MTTLEFMYPFQLSDGVPVFKSTKFGIWPVYQVVNELPPHLRFLQENILLWGVWFGPEKPKMNTFLSPFVQDMKALREEGKCFGFVLISFCFIFFNCQKVLNDPVNCKVKW